MTLNTTKEERLETVNAIIKEISDRGRRFFYDDGNVASLFIRNGKYWYKSEWITDRNPPEICFSVPSYRRLKGWHHGGTLENLIKDFINFVKTGEYSNHLNGYGGLYCPNWGYDETDMLAIQEKAIELGYLIKDKKP